ncbi:MAG: hypothetical protein OER21_07090 [Gemmatimonadota bacterium]|nr:hypothetical protein [Gemmatimonadota bacterium]
MNVHAWMVGLAGLSLVAACTEPATAPGDRDLGGIAPSADWTYGGSNQATEQHILVEQDAAPPLEAYYREFWAVAGKSRSFTIRYKAAWRDREHDEEDDAPTFWRLSLGEHSLRALPDGTPLADGDSVLISVTVDPSRLIVDMGPDALQFDPDEPARLTLFYGYANPDVDRDGDVDRDDDAIKASRLSIWFRANEQSPWEKVSAWHDRERQRFHAFIDHFSGYTVSW